MSDTLLHAEQAYIGALLHMPAPMASQALDLVHDDDVADYLNQKIVTVIRTLVAEGSPPEAMAVLTRARADGVITGAQATRALAARLHDLFAAVPTPASWRLYAQVVIDEALRRRCIAMGTRVQQAAEDSSLEVLIALLDAESRLVRRLHDRRVAAAGAQPQRRSVVGG